jgi:hypothetical protein
MNEPNNNNDSNNDSNNDNNDKSTMHARHHHHAPAGESSAISIVRIMPRKRKLCRGRQTNKSKSKSHQQQ